jgi:hypothetical protein
MTRALGAWCSYILAERTTWHDVLRQSLVEHSNKPLTTQQSQRVMMFDGLQEFVIDRAARFSDLVLAAEHRLVIITVYVNCICDVLLINLIDSTSSCTTAGT